METPLGRSTDIRNSRSQTLRPQPLSTCTDSQTENQTQRETEIHTARRDPDRDRKKITDTDEKEKPVCVTNGKLCLKNL